MPKTAVVILAEGFEEVEAVAPIDALRRAGVRVTVVGLKDKIVKGSRHLSVQTDILLKDLREMPDAIILPGGIPGATNLAQSEDLGRWIREISNAGKIVAAICAAPAVVLSPLGLLNGKKATCHPGCEKDFSPQVISSGERVVVDGNLITSQGPGTAIEFALAVITRLVGKEMSDTVRTKMLVA